MSALIEVGSCWICSAELCCIFTICVAASRGSVTEQRRLSLKRAARVSTRVSRWICLQLVACNAHYAVLHASVAPACPNEIFFLPGAFQSTLSEKSLYSLQDAGHLRSLGFNPGSSQYRLLSGLVGGIRQFRHERNVPDALQYNSHRLSTGCV